MPGGGRGAGAGAAPGASVLGCRGGSCCELGRAGGGPGAVGVGGLPGAGAGRGDRPRSRRRRRERRGSGGSGAGRWSCGSWTWSAGSCSPTGTSAKALTGVDDHSRFCVSARLMPRERTQLVCDGLAAALRSARGARADPDRQRQGVHRPVRPPAGRGAVRPDLPGERDRAPADRSPGRRPRPGRSNGSTARCAPSSTPASVFTHPDAPPKQALDEWVAYYNTRPAAPVPGRCTPRPNGSTRTDAPGRTPAPRASPDRTGDAVGRPARSPPTVSSASAWQQVSVGKHYAGERCDVLVDPTAAAVLDRQRTPARPSPAPAPDRSARRTPQAPADGTRLT